MLEFVLEGEECIIGSLGFIRDELLATLDLPFDILEASIKLLFPLFPIFLHELEILVHLMELLLQQLGPLPILVYRRFLCH